MKWTDNAILLSAKKFGETSAVIRIFSAEHGVYGGVLRGAHSKKNRGIIQPGNTVSVTWQARISDQLGTCTCELLQANTAQIMHDAAKLLALASACALVESALPERHPYPRLYKIFAGFLVTLIEQEFWHEAYVRFELELLADSGFGLDLTRCAATETTEDLIYVSPKSGRAVCRTAGAPYHDKLLALPAFLLHAPSLTLPPAGRGNAEYPLPLAGEGQGGGASLISYARDLRKNQTEAEKTLWYNLRAHRFDGYSFRRQYPIDDTYIADFVCVEEMLIIELDGGQHTEQINYDARRTEFLESKGYKVIRFWNNEVMENKEAVLEQISTALRSPSLTLPRQRERELVSPLPHRGGGLGRGPELVGRGQPPTNQTQEILDGLQLTGYFLTHWLLTPHNRKLPAARARLIQIVNKFKEPHVANH